MQTRSVFNWAAFALTMAIAAALSQTVMSGQAPAVQLDPARPVTEGELRQLVTEALATYKQLRQVVVVDTIPRLPSGKVLRRTLRDEWLGRN